MRNSITDVSTASLGVKEMSIQRHFSTVQRRSTLEKRNSVLESVDESSILRSCYFVSTIMYVCHVANNKGWITITFSRKPRPLGRCKEPKTISGGPCLNSSKKTPCCVAYLMCWESTCRLKMTRLTRFVSNQKVCYRAKLTLAPLSVVPKPT